MVADLGLHDVRNDDSGFVPSRDLPTLTARRRRQSTSLDAIVSGLDAVANALGVAAGQEEQITVVVATEDHQGEDDSDDDDDDVDVFEVHFVRQWLLRLSCMCWNHVEGAHDWSNCEKMEVALARASRLIAILSGQCASGIMHKCYHFATEDEQYDEGAAVSNAAVAHTTTTTTTSVHIGETALVEDSLGGRTWFAAPLLANYMVKLVCRTKPSYEPSLLELGSGTGLVGLTLAARLAQQAVRARVHLTDTNADVLTNLSRNAARNGWSRTAGNTCAVAKSVDAVDVQVMRLHWGEHLMSNGDTRQHSFLDTYDCILAADCVYEAQHAALLRQTAERFLTREHAVGGNDVVNEHDMRGKMFLMAPQRLHHDEELASIEAQFPTMSSVVSNDTTDAKMPTMQLCTTRQELFQVESGDNFGPPRLLSKVKPSSNGDESAILAGRTSTIKARQLSARSRHRPAAYTIDDSLPIADGLHYRLYIIEWVRFAIE